MNSRSQTVAINMCCRMKGTIEDMTGYDSALMQETNTKKFWVKTENGNHAMTKEK